MEEKRYSSFGESLWRQRVYTKRVWHNPNQPVRNYLTHFIPLKKKKKTIESREWEFIGRVSTTHFLDSSAITRQGSRYTTKLLGSTLKKGNFLFRSRSLPGFL